MKNIKFMYDEGYGYGETERSLVGYTVDDVINILKNISLNGGGDFIIVDECGAIDEIEIIDYYYRLLRRRRII